MELGLEELLLSEAVPGLPIDRSSPDGVVDMYEAALADPDPNTALSRLRGHGFLSGALRSWTDGSAIAQVTLHRFASVRDAELAALEQAHGLLASGGVVFDVGLGPPASFGAAVSDVTTTDEDPFTAYVVVRPVRNVMMLVLLGGPGFGPGDVSGLAERQSARLLA